MTSSLPNKDPKHSTWPCLTRVTCSILSNENLNQMGSLQGTLVKRYIGVPKRNHHTAILNALEIQPLQTVTRQQSMSLFSRICKVDSQIRHLYNFTGSIYASQEAMCRNYCAATGSNGNITIRSRIYKTI